MSLFDSTFDFSSVKIEKIKDFNSHIQSLIDDTPDSEEKQFLLDNDVWYTVFPFSWKYSGKEISGYSNDIFYRIDGKWCDMTRNSIFSSAHLFPCFPTPEESRKDALNYIKNSIEQRKKYETGEL